MPKPSLPAHLRARTSTLQDGRLRMLYYVEFRQAGHHYKEPAGDQLAYAKKKRDFLLGQRALGYDFGRDPDTLLSKSEKDKAAEARKNAFPHWAALWLSVTDQKRSHTKDVQSVARLTEFFGAVPLADLSTEQIEAYKRWRSTQPTKYQRPPAPATINRELAALRAIFSLAIDERALAFRPVIHLYTEHNTRSRIASPTELAALLEAVPAWIRPVLIVLRESGMRISEVLGLRVSQVHLTDELLQLSQTKSGRPRLIPMSRAMLAVFREALARRHDGRITSITDHVFLSATGKPLTRYAVSYHFRKACQAQGIEGLTRHDLRATFITDKLDQGWDRDLLKPITGIQSDATFSRYNRLTTEHLRRVMREDGPRKLPAEQSQSAHDTPTEFLERKKQGEG